MGSKVTVSVAGLADLDKALGQLKQGTAKGVLRRVGIAALQPFDEAWRQLAPFDEAAKGKHLRDSGGVGTKLSRSQRRALEKDSFVEVYAGPGPHPKGMQQEFGNKDMTPQPFLRPAWDATRDQVLANVAAQLGTEIQKTAARAAKTAARKAARNG